MRVKSPIRSSSASGAPSPGDAASAAAIRGAPTFGPADGGPSRLLLHSLPRRRWSARGRAMARAALGRRRVDVELSPLDPEVTSLPRYASLALTGIVRPSPPMGPLPPADLGDAMTVSPGRTFPLGASVVDGGANFCVFSRTADAAELLLFDGAGSREPARVIRLDAPTHRTCPRRPGGGAG